MSRDPAITSLLNGQAVKSALASISVTSIRGSARCTNRAAVAPPKPPPITTTRVAVCARAMNGAARRAVAVARRLRRVAPPPRPFPAPQERGRNTMRAKIARLESLAADLSWPGVARPPTSLVGGAAGEAVDGRATPGRDNEAPSRSVSSAPMGRNTPSPAQRGRVRVGVGRLISAPLPTPQLPLSRRG